MSLSPAPNNSYGITALLVRFEDRFAVMQNEMLGEFRWPIANLPQDIQIGQPVTLKVVEQKSEEDEKLTRMRTVLEDLIN